MSPMPSIVPRHLTDLQSCLLEEGRAGHKMAERCAGRRLVSRDWMKVEVSGARRQGLLVQMPGQGIESEAGGAG